MMKLRAIAIFACALAGASTGAFAAGAEGLGLRAGIGTDITGGLAYGINVNKLLKDKYELGVYIFSAHSEYTTEEFHTYKETTDVRVFAAMANVLKGYTPGKAGMYYLAGAGVGLFSVDWEESSPTDTSLGTPLSGGGSKQSASGTAAGMVFNLGLGYSFDSRFGLRAEVPLFLIFSSPGEAAGVVPTFVATVGYRF